MDYKGGGGIQARLWFCMVILVALRTSIWQNCLVTAGSRIIDNVLFGQLTDRTAFYQKQMEQRVNES